MEAGPFVNENNRFSLDFDFNDRGFINDPYKSYREIREKHKVFYSEVLKGWVLMGYTDVARALKNRSLIMAPIPDAADFGPYVKESFKESMLFSDPPSHTRLRKLVAKMFSPNYINDLSGEIQRIAERLLDDITESEFDFMEHYAFPLPLHVICSMLGVPTTEYKTFHEWSIPLARSLDAVATPEQRAESDAAVQRMEYFIDDLVKERKISPENDLISKLLEIEEETEKLTRSELIRICSGLLFAGHETTVNLLGNGLNQLLLHPEQLRRIVEDPELREPAIEEMLRFDSPVQLAVRFVKDPVKFQDQTIPANSMLHCCLGSANRDPEIFDNPDQFVIERQSKPLSFGGGTHVCLGMHLAKLEAKIALNTFLKKVPTVTFSDKLPKRRPIFALRGFESFSVRI